jgi:hypothetical protein
MRDGMIPTLLEYSFSPLKRAIELKVEYLVPERDPLAQSQLQELITAMNNNQGVQFRQYNNTLSAAQESPLKWLDRRINEMTQKGRLPYAGRS